MMTTTDEAAGLAALCNSLVAWRVAAAGARHKARKVYDAVLALSTLEMLLPAQRTLDFLAQAIYNHGGYDARMRYGDIDEFKEELVKDIKEQWPNTRVVNGEEYYVVRPMFDNDGTDFETHLGLSLRACRLSELSELSVAPLDVAGMQEQVSGLSASEYEALIAMHRSEVTRIVNVLRKLNTALYYPVHFLERYAKSTLKREIDPVMPEALPAALAQLMELVQLPGTTPVATYFSSDWDTENKVRNLQLDSELVAYLRQQA